MNASRTDSTAHCSAPFQNIIHHSQTQTSLQNQGKHGENKIPARSLNSLIPVNTTVQSSKSCRKVSHTRASPPPSVPPCVFAISMYSRTAAWRPRVCVLCACACVCVYPCLILLTRIPVYSAPLMTALQIFLKIVTRNNYTLGGLLFLILIQGTSK